MATEKNKAAKPTPADKLASSKARDIWKRLRATEGLTQDKIIERYELLFGEPITQGLVSQYLTGKIPWGLAAVLRFARVFGCNPLDIRDDLPELQSGPGPSSDADLQTLIRLWARLDPPTKRYLVETARHKLQSSSAAESDPFTDISTKSRDRRRTSA